MKIFGISSLLHGCEGMIFTVARLKALDVPLTEERLLITGGTRPRVGKVGRQQQNYVLVQKTKRLYPSHVWDVAAKQRLNFVLNNIYEVSSSRSLRVLLSSHLIPDAGEFKVGAGQGMSAYWATIKEDFVWASGTLVRRAKEALVDLAKEIYEEAEKTR